MRLGILATHPIQYYVPWYRQLTRYAEVDVFFAHRQSPREQGLAGFGVPFDWDVPMLEGYNWRFLSNQARRPNVSTFFGCDTPEIDDVIRDGEYDAFIVQGWYTRSYVQAVIASRRLKVPILIRGDSQLVTPRTKLWRMMKRPAYEWLLAFFDACLYVGKRNREYYEHYGVSPDRLFFAPHAVDNEYFASRAATLQPRRAEMRGALELDEHATVFLFAGKLIEKKRPSDFVRALQLARRENERICGLMVGDGPLMPELKAFCERERLPIRFLGFRNQSEIAEAYVISDAIVLPSDGRETWGLVVNEAMACGAAAIVSDTVGCGPDLVHEGITGNSYPLGDVSALAGHMIAWARDRERLFAAGRSAAELIARYSIAAAAEGTLAAVRQLSSGRTGALGAITDAVRTSTVGARK
jgi:glycosyltransferase involved in cell wall biosynthesis